MVSILMNSVKPSRGAKISDYITNITHITNDG